MGPGRCPGVFPNASSLFPARRNGTWWLLSLYSPHENDQVDWARAEYSATVRGGWTDSSAGSLQKKLVRMIEEGSVVPAAEIRGRAVDVSPDGFAHPVYRSGFALAVPLPPPVEIAPRAVARPVAVPAPPVVTEPGVPEPGVPEPGVPEPGVPEPGVPEPGVPEPGVPEPIVPEPGVSEPGVSEPIVPEPGVPEPVVPEPVVPEPGTPERSLCRTGFRPCTHNSGSN